MTTLTSISMDNMTWSAIDEMVSRMNDYEQGVCVVSPDGIRTINEIQSTQSFVN